MFVRVVFAFTCSVLAVTVARLKRNQHVSVKPANAEEPGDGKEIYTYADAKRAPQEEEEKVKWVSNTFSPALSSRSFQDGDQLLLPEFEDLFQGSVGLQSDSENSFDHAKPRDDANRLKYKSDNSIEIRKYESNSEDDEALDVFEALTSNNRQVEALNSDANTAASAELVQLKALVSDLRQKEMRLKAELLDYYGLKEQQNVHMELEKQLKEKNEEIEKLNAKFSGAEERVWKLTEELAGMESVKKELEVARAKIKDLQKVMQSDAGQTKAHLLMLKQQVATLQEKEQAAAKKDFELEKKMQTLKELEVEIVELRRTNKELQHQKRELMVQFAAAEARIAELSSLTETELVSTAQTEATALRVTNEDLSKQVEGLQMNRFSEVEELVYLRWVNACLRYELRNFQAPPGKMTAIDLGKSLSPRSQEKAKQLMMEYSGPDLLARAAREKIEDEYENSISSLPSTPSEYDFDGDSRHFARRSLSKKPSLIKKLKRWGRSKDEGQLSPASSSLVLQSSPGRSFNGQHSSLKGPLETIMLRNNSDSVAITTYGTNDSESDRHEADAMENSFARSWEADSDMRNPESNVAASFQLMSKSVAGVLEEKYPAFKDRHKLAVAREKAIKEKAEQARAEKLAASFNMITGSPPSPLIKQYKSTPGRLSDKSKVDKLPQRGADIVSVHEQNPERPEVHKLKLSEIQKKEPRVPKPPPKASSSVASSEGSTVAGVTGSGPPPPLPPPRTSVIGPTLPPPPPPPPLGGLKLQGSGGDKVQKAPEVVEFYQALMKREARKDTALAASEVNVSDVRNSMIGEIENRSAFLLAVKADVETQGDFVQSLATEVRNATYNNIEDVVAFVAWLDEELSFLVDERAVLKHFDWPESKADALREAAFEYQDLKRLEEEVSSYEDDRHVPCEVALKKMLALLEKVEQSVYALLRTRDMAIARYKEFKIPTQWMLDSGVIGRIKLATIQLARKYMKRVAAELDAAAASPAKEPQREFLLLQGVRFAFRVHQFAGGFDAKSMQTFEELRDRVRAQSESQEGSNLKEGETECS